VGCRLEGGDRRKKHKDDYAFGRNSGKRNKRKVFQIKRRSGKGKELLSWELFCCKTESFEAGDEAQ
jgi:hypothetical protein